jgi:hypothetical protein
LLEAQHFKKKEKKLVLHFSWEQNINCSSQKKYSTVGTRSAMISNLRNRLGHGNSDEQGTSVRIGARRFLRNQSPQTSCITVSDIEQIAATETMMSTIMLPD